MSSPSHEYNIKKLLNKMYSPAVVVAILGVQMSNSLQIWLLFIFAILPENKHIVPKIALENTTLLQLKNYFYVENYFKPFEL